MQNVILWVEEQCCLKNAICLFVVVFWKKKHMEKFYNGDFLIDLTSYNILLRTVLYDIINNAQFIKYMKHYL